MREVSGATLVCKRGVGGAVAIVGAVPASLDDAQAGPGFPIEVFNVLGAGDGFFAGLLKGWLDDEPWPKALEYANACGAFAVSRHGCTPAYPSLDEMRFFLDRGVTRPDLRNDAELEQLHWSTNRKGDWSTMRVFAFDHRMQLERMEGYTLAKGGDFKRLCLGAALRVQDGRPGYGILCDGRIGRAALHAASGSGLWIDRPCARKAVLAAGRDPGRGECPTFAGSSQPARRRPSMGQSGRSRLRLVRLSRNGGSATFFPCGTALA